ncbi:FliA/WhiG family RNA polymerase sigma factor [Thermocrinis sp.]|jgi:RNA polymerase sigma factor for flagellar operon FliA|uniref:FliA/WhiG family RNA polymerase sigma factor n=1 Tax=Thermocrinis sp. TaxID=2024383 RepID=UPI00260D5F94|nr:FliA/WhiG family RNA polymerase sigma factor [Thermocrinis sp.]
MLSKEEKDKEAILKYLPLVKSIAYRIYKHLPDAVDLNDLIGYGILAVVEALPKLDESKNPEAYLRLRIKGAMYDYLRSLDFGSKSLRKREKEIKAKLEELTNQLGREPTDEELIKALGYKPEEFYSDLQKISASHLLSLDDLFKEGRSYEEFFSSSVEENPEEKAIKQDLREKILKAIEDLDHREKLVLQLIFYEEIPAKEVAKLLKVSTARVSQIKESALSKLREKLKDMV